MLSDLDIARVRRWCAARVPAELRTKVRVECEIAPRHITIVECRPPWRDDPAGEWTRLAIARLRYTVASQRWALYWRDQHERFHRYEQLPPSPHVDDLLGEIEADPFALFWG